MAQLPLSSSALAHIAMRDAPAQFLPFAGPQLGPLEASWRTVRSRAGEHWAAAPQEITDSLIADVLPKVQREYSQIAAQRRFDHLLEQCDESERANLRSHACTSAAAFLRAPPVPGRVMVEHAFNAAVRRRLLLPCLPPEAPADACQCGAPTATLDSQHPFSCTQCSQLIVGRHNETAAQLRQILKEAGVSSTLEPLMRSLFSGAGAAGRNAQGAAAEALRTCRAARA